MTFKLSDASAASEYQSDWRHAVCRGWRDLASDTAFTRHVTGSINDAIQEAQPGDTVIIPSGFYNVRPMALRQLLVAATGLDTIEREPGTLDLAQETVLVDRPLALVGQKITNLRGVPRRSVVIHSRRSVAVLCNAQ